MRQDVQEEPGPGRDAALATLHCDTAISRRVKVEEEWSGYELAYYLDLALAAIHTRQGGPRTTAAIPAAVISAGSSGCRRCWFGSVGAFTGIHGSGWCSQVAWCMSEV